MYSAVTKILHIGWMTCSINQHASIFFFFFFFPGRYLETHSHFIMHAQCLLTWHTLFIISNPLLSLGGEASLCNTAHTVPYDEPCPCWGKNKKKLKKHRRVLAQRYTHIPAIIYRLDWPRVCFPHLSKTLIDFTGKCSCLTDTDSGLQGN